MEDQLIALLTQTQSSDAAPRQAAEQQLQDLYPVEAFPISLASIAAHSSLSPQIRQAALLTLKNYVLATWSPEFDEFKGQSYLNEDVKGGIRQSLLQLATDENIERKIQRAASYVVSKIAIVDFPDNWPSLLDTLLQIIPEATDAKLHGALKVLAELVEEGFEEQQLFSVAQQLVNVVYGVASNENKTPVLRALAVSVFSPLLESLELLQADHGAAVKQFAEQTMTGCLPMFLSIIKIPLNAHTTKSSSIEDGSNDPYHGLIALKIQVVRVLLKLRILFPSLIAPTSMELFTAVMQELSAAEQVYLATYINDEKGGRLEDTDGLPYTLDFLVLENWDFLQSCLRAPPVRKELENQLKEHGPSGWLLDMLRLAISYAQITQEEEGMWEIDVNVFLAEETAVTTNYTARHACSDFVIKIGEWIKVQLIEAIMLSLNSFFEPSQPWKLKEASLYVLNQLITDWADLEDELDASITSSFLQFARIAQQQQESFLRARGYLASGSLLKITRGGVPTDINPMIESAFQSVNKDSSEIVQVSCIRALQYYIQALPKTQSQPLQRPIIQALEAWMASKDIRELNDGDDLLITLVETLRDVIMLDVDVCIHGSGLNLLFTVASGTAANFQMIELVTDAFEEICKIVMEGGSEKYTQLCQRVLPSLVGAFDVGNLTDEDALMSLAAELLSILANFGPKPLPAGIVSTIMPKLNRILLMSSEEDLLRACTTTLKHIIAHDPEQVWSWDDGAGKSGLETVLVIVDRLLGPSVEDAAAAEVGGLASEIVEKAGAEKLGPYLMQLLQAVARRVSTAEQTHLVQSLISVFAKLTLSSATEVVDFLSQVQIGEQSGLHVVMAKWLDNADFFTGYDDIRQTTTALGKLYTLHDPRVEAVLVRGELIVPTSNRIVTRSKAKSQPDQYTTIPVPVKIIKLLVDELAVGGVANDLAGAAGAGDVVEDDDEDGEDDGDWEDEPGAFDNFAGLGASKAELLAFADETPLQSRQRDDETQRFLGDFFRGVATEPGFENVFNALTPAEQDKLRTLN